MTFNEAKTFKKNFDWYSKECKKYAQQKLVYCKEVQKKVCTKIRCYDCVRYSKPGCCRDNLSGLFKDELDELVEWAGVKIRAKFPEEVSREILEKGER